MKINEMKRKEGKKQNEIGERKWEIRKKVKKK